jgi:AcrR family transcriptional regulator
VQRRNEILACATDLFASKGFDLTTMDDIAEAARITKRTLYRYVTSKDELLYDLHDTFTDQSLVPGNPDEHEDAVAEFRALVAQHVRTVTEHQKEIGVFFEERKHLTGQNARLIEKRRDAYERYGVSVIDFGIASGEFVELNPRPVAQAILGAMTEMYHWYRPGLRLTPTQIADLFADLFLYGAAVDRRHELIRDPASPQVRTHTPHYDGAAQRVRDAAIREFARAGYHATSMRDLADVADVTKGAVMYHAGYKQRLLEDIHRTAFEEATEILQAAEPQSGNAIDSLYRFLVAHMGYLARNSDAIGVVSDNMRYLEPAALERISTLRDRWRGILRETIARGIAEGELRNLDAGFLTRTLIGMLNSTARWYSPKGQLQPEDLADIYMRLLMFGVSANLS